MLSSITPLGERGRQRRWGATVTAYAVGSVVAGSALGAVLGLLPSPSARAALVALAVASAVAALLDLRPRLLPTVRRQVNEDWLGVYRGWVCGAGFGLQLGLGVVTIVTTSAVYVALLAAALSPSWVTGAVVGGTFGLVRAVPALLLRGITTTDRLVSLTRRLDSWAPAARRTTVAVLATASAACTVAVLA